MSSLTDVIKCFLIGNSNRVWELSNNFSDFIISDLLSDESKENFIRELNGFENIDNSVTVDVKLLFGDENFEQKLDNYKKSIGDIISKLENSKKSRILNAVEKTKTNDKVLFNEFEDFESN